VTCVQERKTLPAGDPKFGLSAPAIQSAASVQKSRRHSTYQRMKEGAQVRINARDTTVNYVLTNLVILRPVATFHLLFFACLS
jgi:hypothetical protein